MQYGVVVIYQCNSDPQSHRGWQRVLNKNPGKHEIVQGAYGKYQGMWIPLERGRDITMQYGVIALLKPLFDFRASNECFNASSSYGACSG
ncbi:hypothetical protein BT96DRAFT_836751 [Gymnopus androsaceus JB14]|uniref:HTH APSES-type domain-containing protein n=1 Tax=Gymnopus androsaceus JB14 TaxID=1447944 RepID=A0A6A4GRP0_9AGAR|nr:hypothetical protein BT96DRAFT_836751 [Gymnopus androsaceus JB14]